MDQLKGEQESDEKFFSTNEHSDKNEKGDDSSSDDSISADDTYDINVLINAE